MVTGAADATRMLRGRSWPILALHVTCPHPHSLRAALREGTRDLHARLDRRVADGFVDLDAYGRYLQAMHAFMRAAAHAVPQQGDWNTAHACLADDLHALGVAPMSMADEATADCDAARIGWAYVVRGSSLGARVLLRAAQGVGADARGAARFLIGHAAASADWPQFVDALDAHPHAADAQHRARMLAAARDAFHAADAAFSIAYEGPRA